MTDDFDPQWDPDDDGECLDAFAEQKIYLKDSEAPVQLVDQVTRAVKEVHSLIRYALIILGREPKADQHAIRQPVRLDPGKKRERQERYARKAMGLDLDLIREEYPDHCFHPCAMALMVAVDMAQERWNAYLDSPARQQASARAVVHMRQQLARDVVAHVLDASRTAKYRADCERIRHTTWQRMASTNELIKYMFEKRSRLLCVRVDLRYRHFFRGERYDASLPGHPSFEMVGVHRENLLNILRRQIFKDIFFGYILRVEWAPGTGFHLHLMLLIDGRERRGGVEIGDLIGSLWRTKVTQGQGYDFNCNREALKGRYPVRGTGMFHHADKLGRQGLKTAAEYLCKADHFISFYRNDRQRTYFRSRISSVQ